MVCTRSADGNSVTCTSGRSSSSSPSPTPSPTPSVDTTYAPEPTPTDTGTPTPTDSASPTPTDAPSPVMAAADPQTPVDPASALTQAELDAAVTQAEAEWAAVAPAADFTGVVLTVGDLDPGWLGSEQTGLIVIDADAAGWGWDVTFPADPAAAHMDLLTVVRHELGHVLGLEHSADTVMAATLDAGRTYPVDASLLADAPAAAPVDVVASPTEPTSTPADPADPGAAPTDPAAAPTDPTSVPTAPTTVASDPSTWTVSADGTTTLVFNADGTATANGVTKSLADVSQIVVEGGSGDDSLVVDRGSANPTLTISFDGGPGFDTLTFLGTSQNVVSRPTDGSSGSLALDATVVHYSGIEPLYTGGSVTTTFDLAGGDDTCTLSGGGSSLTLDCPGDSETTTFGVPTTSLTIIGGDGKDVVHVSGAPNLVAAALIIDAEQITLDSGLNLTVGDLTLTAAQTVTGGPTLGCVISLPPTTHCADVFVTLSGAFVSAAKVIFGATATITPDAFQLLTVQAKARVTITNSTLNASDDVVIKAEAKVGPFDDNSSYFDIVFVNADAAVTVDGTSAIHGQQGVSLSSKADVEGTAAPGTDAGKNDADGTGKKDAAAAALTVVADAITKITDAALATAAGALTLTATNHAKVDRHRRRNRVEQRRRRRGPCGHPADEGVHRLLGHEQRSKPRGGRGLRQRQHLVRHRQPGRRQGAATTPTRTTRPTRPTRRTASPRPRTATSAWPPRSACS